MCSSCAWLERDKGWALPLRELVGQDWYARHEWPAYVQGAILVDYILRKFGPERFLSLYTTCRQATFDDDCRRILGVTVDELDEDCWAEVERGEGPGGYARRWLSSLELGPQVDRASWDRFLSDYFKSMERIAAQYDQVRFTAEWAFATTTANGATSSRRLRYEFKRSGERALLKAKSPYREDVYLAHPEHSVHAERPGAGDAWEIVDEARSTREQSYRKIVREIRRTEPVAGAISPFIGLADGAANRGNSLRMKVAKLEKVSEEGRPWVRVELEECPPGHPVYRRVKVRFAGDDYLQWSAEALAKDGSTWRGDRVVAEQSAEGAQLLLSTHDDARGRDGSSTDGGLTVTERQFGPVPEDEFTPERVFEGAVVQRVADRAAAPEAPAVFSWYLLPIVLGAVSLAGGAGLFAWSRG